MTGAKTGEEWNSSLMRTETHSLRKNGSEAPMGPILSFDKSFLEMLSPEDVDELDLQFELFMTPILVSEIQADLKHPSPRQTGKAARRSCESAGKEAGEQSRHNPD